MKNQQNKYGVPLVFRTPITIPLKTDPTVLIDLIPMTYKQVQSIIDKDYISSCIELSLSTKSFRELLALHIVNTYNTIGFPSILDFTEQLSDEDTTYLVDVLYKISLLTPIQNNNLHNMLDLAFSKELQDENWACDACQHKRLQKYRACHMIPEEERSKEFSIKLNGKLYLECPKNSVDGFIIGKAYEAYTMYKGGILPELGGLGDQTMWFVEVSQMVANKTREMESKAIT